MSIALARHDAIVRGAVEAHRGVIVKMIGDGVYATFADTLDALLGALEMQQALANPALTNGIPLQIRCGLHRGTAEKRDNDFFGGAVNRAARVMGTAHGGQVLLSQAVVDNISGCLPPPASLRDLGAVRLRDLGIPERVYQLLHPQLRQDFPALRSLEATPNNIPQQITSFVGRERELAEVRRLLHGARLLTLVGPGGIGKTRLSLHAAADLLDEYPDGVWIVELAAIVAPDLVEKVAAQVLGVQEAAGESLTQTLATTLKSRRLLLVLDNCEHLLMACAGLAHALLQAVPGLRILATGREPLRVTGEQIYPLPPLSLPDPKVQIEIQARSDAVQLFVERARLQQPNFALTKQGGSTVAELCIRLDGMPLALELAAARVGAMSVEEIAERLTDRLSLLTGGSRTALPRQQTLRAMIDWSYDLLSDAEKALFARLSVFAGGWTLGAVAKVAGDGDSIAQAKLVDHLTGLVSKSLVVFDAHADRYWMLETIREYSRERLANSGEEAAFRRRSRDYFLALAEEAAAVHLNGGPLEHWTERLRLESDNLRSALRLSLDEPAESEAALRLCGALYSFWWRWGRASEGRDWCDAALAGAPSGRRGRAMLKALISAGMMHYTVGQLATAQTTYDQALTLSRELSDATLEGLVLRCQGTAELSLGHSATAQALYEQSIVIHREAADRALEATSLNCLASLFINDGNLVAAEVPLERALVLSQELGNREQEAYTVSRLGSISQYRRDDIVAQARHHQALVIARELGVRELESEQLRHLAEVAVGRGDFETARTFLCEALVLSRDQNSWFAVRECLEAMAILATSTREFGEAAKLWGAVDQMRAAMLVPRFPVDQQRYDASLADCSASLGKAAYIAAITAGRALGPDEAVASALTWLGEPRPVQ